MTSIDLNSDKKSFGCPCHGGLYDSEGNRTPRGRPMTRPQRGEHDRRAYLPIAVAQSHGRRARPLTSRVVLAGTGGPEVLRAAPPLPTGPLVGAAATG